MKYLKVWITTVVVLMAVSGAVGTTLINKCYNCDNATLYYYNGVVYMPAGRYGYDFYCEGTVGVCCWYRPNPFEPDYYAPCKYGAYATDQQR
jgi:hypothetical protein